MCDVQCLLCSMKFTGTFAGSGLGAGSGAGAVCSVQCVVYCLPHVKVKKLKFDGVILCSRA